jgi:hypothetical protein
MTRPSRRTTFCTRTTASVWPPWPIWTSCRQGRDPDCRAAEDQAGHRLADPGAGAGCARLIDRPKGGAGRWRGHPSFLGGRHGFDHIIIGSGINGLVAAAMLAKKGDRVLVLERERPPWRLPAHRGQARCRGSIMT